MALSRTLASVRVRRSESTRRQPVGGVELVARRGRQPLAASSLLHPAVPCALRLPQALEGPALQLRGPRPQRLQHAAEEAAEEEGEGEEAMTMTYWAWVEVCQVLQHPAEGEVGEGEEGEGLEEETTTGKRFEAFDVSYTHTLLITLMSRRRTYVRRGWRISCSSALSISSWCLSWRAY